MAVSKGKGFQWDRYAEEFERYEVRMYVIETGKCEALAFTARRGRGVLDPCLGIRVPPRV